MAKKRKTRTRKKRKGKSYAPAFFPFASSARAPRKIEGSGAFARVARPPTHFPEGAPIDFAPLRARAGRSSLGSVPHVAPGDLDEVRAQNVFDGLVRYGEVDPALAAELVTIDPDGTYVAVFTVRGGSGSVQADDGEASKGGGVPERRIVIVGRGRRIWSSAMNISNHEGEIVSVEIKQTAQPGTQDESFPLWSGQTVVVAGGDRVEGTGNRALYEVARAKAGGGRKKKSGGGMTAEERRQKKTLRRQSRKREKDSEARAAALIASGDAKGAATLLKRASAGRFGHAKPRAKKRGRKKRKR